MGGGLGARVPKRRAPQLIINDKDRRLTFQRRKQCLLKKARELSILCDVDVCVVIDSTASSITATEPVEIWPPVPAEVHRIIDRYHRDIHDSKKRKANVAGLDDYLAAKRVKVGSDHTGSVPAPVSDDELIAGFSREQLESLLTSLGDKIRAAKDRLPALRATQLVESGTFGSDSESDVFRENLFTF